MNNKISLLSDTQYRIFCDIGKWKSTREIARTPGQNLSVKTIETHISHIRKKMGLKSLLEVRKAAVEHIAEVGSGRVERVVIPKQTKLIIHSHEPAFDK